MPLCEGVLWKGTCFPCKHLFVIFRHHPNWSWENMSLEYQSSPSITLDKSVVHFENPPVTLEYPLANVEFPKGVNSGDDNQVVDSSYQTSKPKVEEVSLKPKASSCGEILSKLKSITYLLDDSTELANLENMLFKRFQS